MHALRVILFGIVLGQLTTFTIGASRFGIELASDGIAAGLYRFGGLEPC